MGRNPNGKPLMFVERSQQNGEETVILRYAAAFYWLMWPTLVITAIASFVASVPLHIGAVVAWILLLFSAAPYWPIISTIKKQMREAEITASGSKYSFTNPLQYRWRVDHDSGSES